MGRSSFSVLSRDEMDAVHHAALSILSEVGMRVKSPAALELLCNGGAAVDMRGQIAKIPESMVSEALKATAREFVLGSRSGERDLPVPASSHPWICTDGFATEILDARTGERRPSTNDDLIRFARLGDAMDPLDFFWPIVNPSDYPGKVQMLRAFVTSLENTAKHIQHEALGSRTARAEITAAAIVAGGMKELERRPLFSAVQCPIAPLTFEEGSIEAAMEFAKAGVPVVYMSMPMMGGSAPITSAGAVVQGHAEVLGGLIISNLVKRGARVFHCVLTGPMDMATGVWASGSPENAIGNAASVQLAKHLGLPAMGGGFGTCAKVPGIQIGYEKMATMVPVALSRADIITGVGGFDDAKCMSMVQAVIDIEMWTMVLRIVRGIDTSEDSLGVESIQAVGPGGLFLSQRETLEKFRSELWLPTLGERQSYESWRSGGGGDITKKATERAIELSSSPPVHELEHDVIDSLENLVAEATKET